MEKSNRREKSRRSKYVKTDRRGRGGRKGRDWDDEREKVYHTISEIREEGAIRSHMPAFGEVGVMFLALAEAKGVEVLPLRKARRDRPAYDEDPEIIAQMEQAGLNPRNVQSFECYYGNRHVLDHDHYMIRVRHDVAPSPREFATYKGLQILRGEKHWENGGLVRTTGRYNKYFKCTASCAQELVMYVTARGSTVSRKLTPHEEKHSNPGWNC